MFHELGVVDTDQEAEIAEAALQVGAVGEQVLARSGDSGRGFVNPEAIALAEYFDELRKGQGSPPGGEVEVDQGFEDGVRQDQ